MKNLKERSLIISLMILAILLYSYLLFGLIKVGGNKYDSELKKERNHQLKYQYELEKVYMNEVMLCLKLEQNDNDIYDVLHCSILPSLSTKEQIDKFIKNISEIYIDYMDDGNEENYKPLITILGLDKNFEGDLEFKINRIIQSLAFKYIKERDYYVNGDEINSICGYKFLHAIGSLLVRINTNTDKCKTIKCYRKNKDDNYIELETRMTMKEYFE